MKLSFLKKKTMDNFESIVDVSRYLSLKNRELKIDTLTPFEADNINTLIRFWNIEDEELNKTFAEREPIKIYINSLGGSLDAALTIVDSITMSRTPVYTFNIGTIQKESFLIYLAGHKRLTYENATFLFTTLILSSDKLVLDSEKEKTTYYSKEKLLEEREEKIKTFFLDRVKMSDVQYYKYNKKELWFSSSEAIKLHISNEILRRHFHFVKQK